MIEKTHNFVVNGKENFQKNFLKVFLSILLGLLIFYLGTRSANRLEVKINAQKQKISDLKLLSQDYLKRPNLNNVVEQPMTPEHYNRISKIQEICKNIKTNDDVYVPNHIQFVFSYKV